MNSLRGATSSPINLENKTSASAADSIVTLFNNLSEGSSNLYYTNARVDARIAANPSGDPAGTAVAMAIAL